MAVDFKLLGKVIGTVEGWESVDDGGASLQIQLSDFKSNLISSIPSGNYISIDLLEGTWTRWHESGEPESEGKIAV